MFQFGQVRASEKRGIKIEKFDSLLKEHYQPGKKYYLFLVDSIYNKNYLDILSKDIEKSKISSYNIVSVISVNENKTDSTEELSSYESNWKRYVNFNDTECECIMAFGGAMRVLNKSGDVNYYDFIDDKFNDPRYFCGSEFVNGPDKWIYPVASVRDLYPIQHGNDPTNYLTRFFREKLERIQRDDMSTVSLDMRDYRINYIETKEEVSNILKQLCNSELLAYDSETNSLDHNTGSIGYVILSNDGENSYIFDWHNIDIRLLKQVITTAKRSTGSNLKFDFKFCKSNGLSKKVKFTDDTTLLSHALNSSRNKGLKSGAIFYVGKFVGYDNELNVIKKKLKVDNFLQIPKDILFKYAGLDPIVNWRLQKALDKHVAEIDKKFPNEKDPTWTIERWYREVMIPNANTCTNVELDGIYFDPAQFEKQEILIKDKIKELELELTKTWNISENFEFGSTKKLGELFKQMGWPCISEAKASTENNKVYSTSDSALTEYEIMGKPGIKTLKKYRSYNVALKTFIEGWRKWLFQHPDGTWRIHPNCNTFGAESMRHAMRDPNFQQIPARGEIAAFIKKLFVVPPNINKDSKESDWLIVNADFRSLQFILALADCGLNKNGVDQVAYDIYGPKGIQDAHSMTTHNIFCKSVNLEIIEIEDEDGNKIVFGEEQQIKIKRPGCIDEEDKEMIIKGNDFLPSDIFVSYI